MRTEALLSTFMDGTCVELTFDTDERTIVMRINEETQQQRYQLCFEQCLLVRFEFPDDLEEDHQPMYNVFNLIEKTEVGSNARRFNIDFLDDSILEIRCAKFWMEPIDGFWLHANPPPQQ